MAFHRRGGVGDEDFKPWSTGRFVAFCFALAICSLVLILSKEVSKDSDQTIGLAKFIPSVDVQGNGYVELPKVTSAQAVDLYANKFIPSNFSKDFCSSFTLTMRLSRAEYCTGIDDLTKLSAAFQIENCHAATRSQENADAVETKIRKLAENNVFVFFRGAAALFDYDMMCADPHFHRKFELMPRVISNGDCHPENFGVMVQANEKLVWGVNDFDQSFNTPFAWDVKRGATGFYLGCTVRDFKSKVCQTVADSFIRAYLITVNRKNCTYLDDERFIEGSAASGKYKIITDLFQKARDRETKQNTIEWLEKKMGVDVKMNKFVETDEIKPPPDSLIPKFQESVNAYLYHGVSALAKFPNNGFYQVQSVARKLGSGTGSIGLDRYYILIKGRYEQYGNIILEMKEETNSVLEVFFNYKYTASQEGKRATDAEHSAWPYANLFYGWTTYDDNPYILKEKSKHHVSADLDQLDEAEYMSLAEAAGTALGFYHIRARCPNARCELAMASALDKETCHQLQDYLKGYDGDFGAMISRFAGEEATRQIEAWKLLKRQVAKYDEEKKSLLHLLTIPIKPHSSK